MTELFASVAPMATMMPRSWEATVSGVKIGVNGVHELVTLSVLRRIAGSRRQKLVENELTDCHARRLTAILGVKWRRKA